MSPLNAKEQAELYRKEMGTAAAARQEDAARRDKAARRCRCATGTDRHVKGFHHAAGCPMRPRQ